MALPDIRAVATIGYSVAGSRQFTSTLYYTPDFEFSDPVVTADELATLVDSTIGPLLRDVLTPDAAYDGAYVVLYKDGAAFAAEEFTEAGLGMDSAGDFLPNDNAVCIRKFTLVPGRSGQGRWFFSAIPEARTDQNFLSPGGTGAYVALAEGLVGALTGVAGDWSPRHWNRKNDSYDAIVGFLVDRQIKRSDRRRLRAKV